MFWLSEAKRLAGSFLTAGWFQAVGWQDAPNSSIPPLRHCWSHQCTRGTQEHGRWQHWHQQPAGLFGHRITEWERAHKNHQVQLWAVHRTTQNQTLCLKALSRCSLNSGTGGRAHSPGQPVPCPPPSGADPVPNALSGSGISSASHGKGMCPEFAYTRRNGNVHMEEEWPLLIFSVDSLMENNSLTWKWMASLAVLTYGIMQLEPVFLPKAIYIWISSDFHFNLETGIEPMVCMRNNKFIIFISRYFIFVRKWQGPRSPASHSSPLWAVSHGVVLKVFPGKSPVHISTVSVWLQLCSFSLIFCFDSVSGLGFPFALSEFKN